MKEYGTTVACFVTAALLTACAAPVQTTTLADGSRAYLIDCEGTARGLNMCFEKAGKSCGAEGYTIVGKRGQRLSSSDVADAEMQDLMKAYATDKSSILVKCGS